MVLQPIHHVFSAETAEYSLWKFRRMVKMPQLFFAPSASLQPLP